MQGPLIKGWEVITGGEPLLSCLSLPKSCKIYIIVMAPCHQMRQTVTAHSHRLHSLLVVSCPLACTTLYIFEFLVDSFCSFKQRIADSGHCNSSPVAPVTLQLMKPLITNCLILQLAWGCQGGGKQTIIFTSLFSYNFG